MIFLSDKSQPAFDMNMSFLIILKITNSEKMKAVNTIIFSRMPLLIRSWGQFRRN